MKYLWHNRNNIKKKKDSTNNKAPLAIPVILTNINRTLDQHLLKGNGFMETTKCSHSLAVDSIFHIDTPSAAALLGGTFQFALFPKNHEAN